MIGPSDLPPGGRSPRSGTRDEDRPAEWATAVTTSLFWSPRGEIVCERHYIGIPWEWSRVTRADATDWEHANGSRVACEGCRWEQEAEDINAAMGAPQRPQAR